MASKSFITNKSWDSSVLKVDIVSETGVTPTTVEYDDRVIFVEGDFTAQNFTDIENNIINA